MSELTNYDSPPRNAALVIALSLLIPSAPAWCDESRSAPREKPRLALERDFPAGSGEVIEIDQVARHIKIQPTEYENRGWACWWYIRVAGIQPGEVITLEVGPPPWATPTQAVFSTDNRSWKQTKSGILQGKSIVYKQRIDAPIAWFAWGPPFTPGDAKQLVASAEQVSPAAEAFQLCQTRDGRAVPALRISNPADRAVFGVWVQARQHAWESGSSWVCRGFVEWLVSEDPRAASLRDLAEINVVPIMDVDSAFRGAGGKNQSPHDHNRDWGDAPHWPAVAAAMQSLRQLDDQRRLDLFIDLHNPGASTTRPFFYITPRSLLGEWRQRNLDRFLAANRIEMTGPLSFVGETRESGSSYDRQWERISKNWVSRNTRGHVVAVTLETAWNTKNSNVAGYETVGRQLGLAIERYLRLNPRETADQEKEPGQR